MVVLLRETAGGSERLGDAVIRSRASAEAETLIVVFERLRVLGCTSISGPFRRPSVAALERPSSLAGLLSMKTLLGLTPCRRRVTPVNVVYASLGFSEATSFYMHMGKLNNRRYYSTVAHSFSQKVASLGILELVL